MVKDLGKLSREKICFNFDVVQRGGGGLTQIQIVRGVFYCTFSAKVPCKCPRKQENRVRGGGQGDFDNVQIEVDFLLG